MIKSPPGELRLVAASSEAMEVVELFELQSAQGPCLDAFRTGEPVGQVNLRSESERWRRFSVVALGAGFSSVLALPLRLRESTIGALNLFTSDDSPITESDILVARGLADLATISVLQHGAASEAQRVNEQLSHALASRVVIEQAKGVISERAGIDLPAAFTRLRQYARANSIRLADVARAAIDGTLDERAWSGPPNKPNS
jgi:GAF domain-containing protein